MIEPVLDYVLAEEIKPDQGAVTSTDIADHWQKYKVLAVGPGRMEQGEFIQVPCQVGDTVYVQKHAEADTPPELVNLGQALIMGTRIMGVIK